MIGIIYLIIQIVNLVLFPFFMMYCAFCYYNYAKFSSELQASKQIDEKPQIIRSNPGGVWVGGAEEGKIENDETLDEDDI